MFDEKPDHQPLKRATQPADTPTGQKHDRIGPGMLANRPPLRDPEKAWRPGSTSASLHQSGDQDIYQAVEEDDIDSREKVFKLIVCSGTSDTSQFAAD